MKPSKPDIIINPAEVVALGERTAQARLNSGCVCAGGCESCDRLAEAFEAMQAALVALDAAGGHTEEERLMIFRCLKLAERVKP